MQFKSTFVIAALATLAAAGQGGQCEPASSCSTGPIQCCESLTTSTSAPAVAALTLIGLVLGSTAANLGLSCTSLVGGTCNVVRLSAARTTATVASSLLAVFLSSSEITSNFSYAATAGLE
ncbi:hypothetical protein D9757_007878 [Collybiopsis confluens]|uniref:Hydrophobin n=1 Tax=Collybiopsis confluens TaxID=2823264 RepID=A0A8H5M5A2_9AGAR|nr:hypothetical protein D9757_007878 [Collybiopsis confluens]